MKRRWLILLFSIGLAPVGPTDSEAIRWPGKNRFNRKKDKPIERKHTDINRDRSTRKAELGFDAESISKVEEYVASLDWIGDDKRTYMLTLLRLLKSGRPYPIVVNPAQVSAFDLPPSFGRGPRPVGFDHLSGSEPGILLEKDGIRESLPLTSIKLAGMDR